MKPKNQTFSVGRGVRTLALLLLGGMAVASCADRYDGKERFESSVMNTQLSSPNLKEIAIVVSADGSSQTISWPVVEGAGGYKVSLTDTTDPTKAVAVVKDSLVDGCSLTVSRTEDTNYSLSIQTMGNSKYNNTDAPQPTVYSFTTFLEHYAEIPANTDLRKWFQENPTPADSVGKHLVYDLAAGGQYTIDGPLDFGLQTVTLRTPSVLRATITYTDSTSLYTQAGLNLKNLIIDCGKQTSSSASVIQLSKEPSDQILGRGGKDYYNIFDPITIQNCEIKNVNGYLFYDSGKKYATQNFLIKNSVITLTSSSSASVKDNALINAYGGGIMHFKMDASTIWAKEGEGIGDQKFFLRYNNSFREDRVIDTAVYPDNKVEVSFVSSTLYRVCKTGQLCNYDGIINRAATTFSMTKSIFVDCGSGQIPRRFVKSLSSNVTYIWQDNTYWFDGAAETSAPDYDKSGTILESDPAFADPAGGNFKPNGADQIAKRTGDPRWL